MTGLTHRRARVAAVLAGAATLLAVAALGAGAIATPAASPDPSAEPEASAGATADADTEGTEGTKDAESAKDAESTKSAKDAGGTPDAGRPATPPGQTEQKEAQGNGLGPRSTVPVDCASARNHGEYVSGVARSTPPGPDKAATVAAAAQADCPAGFRDRPDD
jgi:hypothetical protein